MKKLSLRKEILLVVAIIAITFALSTSVFATSNAPVQIPIINVNTNTTENTTTNTTENTVTNTVTVTPTTTESTNTTVVSTYQNTTLPQTGDASDYAIFALIGLCVVVAVVAYRKARNYNI